MRSLLYLPIALFALVVGVHGYLYACDTGDDFDLNLYARDAGEDFDLELYARDDSNSFESNILTRDAVARALHEHIETLDRRGTERMLRLVQRDLALQARATGTCNKCGAKGVAGASHPHCGGKFIAPKIEDAKCSKCMARGPKHMTHADCKGKPKGKFGG